MPDAPASELGAFEPASFELAGAHWPIVEQGMRRLLVIPVGSLEQHGPHLPLDTDTRIAVRPLGQILPLLREHGVRAVSVNGVLGDPAGASAAEGRLLLARLADSLNAAIDQLLARRGE